MTDKPDTSLSALRESPNLRTYLTDILAERVLSGEFEPGEKLPTEQALVAATGVSRTVVREALATLRARGLITTRQGLGAFVSTDPRPPNFSVVPDSVTTVDGLLQVLEIRLGIEAEASALAAERRSRADIAQMRRCLKALGAALADMRDGTAEDLAFHREIVKATRNPYYIGIFNTFGSILMPRQWAHFDQMPAADRRRHVSRQRREHEAILNAIVAADAAAARRALRSHLAKAIVRFHDLRNRVK